MVLFNKCRRCGCRCSTTSKLKLCRSCYLDECEKNRKRVCVDCGDVLKNRSKKTVRCRKCHFRFNCENKTGRTLPNCKICGNQISTKKNITGCCQKCSHEMYVPWNKGVTGLIPWNKGISKFKTNEEYRIHSNLIRKNNRRFETIQQKMSDRIRTLIRNHIIRGGKRKSVRSEQLLGCTHKFFKEYIQNLFKDGMCWENYGNGYGKWNIDHIKPVSLFDLTLIEEQKKAFHFLNCQPMWAIENIKKRNTFSVPALLQAR